MIDPVTTRRGRLALFGALYFSEGAPIGFLWWALPPSLRAAGIEVEEITAFTASITLPWMLKPLFAPLVDVLTGPRLTLRHLVLGAQLLMGLALAPLLFVTDLAGELSLVRTFLVLHAFAAAMQDVAVDAWAIRTTSDDERGRVNGAMQVGKLTARWAFGAGLLLLPGGVSMATTVVALVSAVWSSAALVLVSGHGPPALATPHAEHARLSRYVAHLRDALSRRATWVALALALVSGAGFEAAGALAGTFLVDRGFEAGSIAAFYTAGVVMSLVGSALGGALSDRLGRVRTFAVSLVLVAALVLAAAGADHLAHEDASGATFALLVAVYFGYGAFIASSYALYMALTERTLAATQFSAYMGATNGCEAWSGWAGGRLAGALGYPGALAAMAAVSLASLPLLALVPKDAETDEALTESSAGS